MRNPATQTEQAAQPTTSSWRDRVRVHPAADMFPMMSDEDLLTLGKDIAENGLKVAVTCWTPKKFVRRGRQDLPKEVFLLDGRNRLEAIERVITDPAERAAAINDALRYDWFDRDNSALLLHGDKDDPFVHVISTNLHRRHLSSEQKREVIATLLRAAPERSDRATAKIAKVDHKTIGAVREGLEASGEIPHVEVRTDTAGRQQPSHKPAPKLDDDAAPTASSRAALARKIQAAARDLNADRVAIAAMPLAARVGHVRSFLKIFDVGPDDLRPIDEKIR